MLDLVLFFFARRAYSSELLGDMVNNQWPPMKVYVYELPHKFNKELLETQIRWGNDYTNYKHSMFHFFIEVELHRQLLKSPLRTDDPDEADLFYVPWYTTIGWFSGRVKDEHPVLNLLMKKYPYWNKTNGADHVITQALPVLPNPIFNPKLSHEINAIISSVDLDTKSSSQTWQGRKNIVIPYISYHPKYKSIDAYWNQKRPNKIFLAMSSTTGRTNPAAFLLRKRIKKSLSDIEDSKILMIDAKNETDVQYVIDQVPLEMTKSQFCIVPEGDSPSSKRLYDAIHYGCIPVVISDRIQYAYDGIVIDYSKFVIQVKSDEVDNIGDIIRKISEEKQKAMRNEMKKAAKRLRFDIGEKPVPGEGLWSYAWMLYTKLAFMKPTNLIKK